MPDEPETNACPADHVLIEGLLIKRITDEFPRKFIMCVPTPRPTIHAQSAFPLQP